MVRFALKFRRASQNGSLSDTERPSWYCGESAIPAVSSSAVDHEARFWVEHGRRRVVHLGPSIHLSGLCQKSGPNWTGMGMICHPWIETVGSFLLRTDLKLGVSKKKIIKKLSIEVMWLRPRFFVMYGTNGPSIRQLSEGTFFNI